MFKMSINYKYQGYMNSWEELKRIEKLGGAESSIKISQAKGWVLLEVCKFVGHVKQRVKVQLVLELREVLNQLVSNFEYKKLLVDGQWQPCFASLVHPIHFSEIIITPSGFQPFLSLLPFHSHRLHFTNPLCIPDLINLHAHLHHYPQVHFTLCQQSGKMEQLIKQCYQQSNNQIITLLQNSEYILTMGFKQPYGFYLHVNQYEQFYDNITIKDVLKMLLEGGRHFTCKFDTVVQGILDILQMVFSHLPTCEYLIQLGHQVEVTHTGVVLNSAGMADEIVGKIFKLMHHPSHYELTLYIEEKYMPLAIGLFMEKPLIQFYCFLPHHQLTDEILNMVNEMSSQASALRRKIMALEQLKQTVGEEKWDVIMSAFTLLSPMNIPS